WTRGEAGAPNRRGKFHPPRHRPANFLPAGPLAVGLPSCSIAQRRLAMDIYDAIYTLRAMRRLKTDPVPEELVWKVLDAAIRAPSGGNQQPWAFVVVTDAEKKRKIGEWYLEAWDQAYAVPAMKEAMLANPLMAKTFKSADHLARNIAEVPVLIFAA